MLKPFITYLFISLPMTFNAMAMGYLEKAPPAEMKNDTDQESCSAKCSTLAMKCHQKCVKKMYKPDHKHVCEDGCDMATTLMCHEFCFIEPLQKRSEIRQRATK